MRTTCDEAAREIYGGLDAVVWRIVRMLSCSLCRGCRPGLKAELLGRLIHAVALLLLVGRLSYWAFMPLLFSVSDNYTHSAQNK